MSRGEPQIVAYEDKYRSAFERLNREWIEAWFEVVEEDERLFSDPREAIIEPGGEILFVLLPGRREPAGTLALITHGEGRGELAKMAVTASCQGLGLGRMLGEAAVKRARALGWTQLLLESNRRLKPALGLYRKLGFEEVALDPDSAFSRADIRMRLLLHRLP